MCLLCQQACPRVRCCKTPHRGRHHARVLRTELCQCDVCLDLPDVLPVLTTQRLSVGALAVVAVYDGWQSRRLALESAALTAKIKSLNAELIQDE